MKNVHIYFALLLVSTVAVGAKKNPKKPPAKRVNPVAKGAYVVPKNPRKVAQEVSQQVFKTTGVNTSGIVGNVNEVQASLFIIKKGVDTVQQAMHAPRSPLLKSKIVSQKMIEFQKKATAILKMVGVSSVKRALSSKDALEVVLKKIPNKQQQDSLRNVYETYNAVVTDIDAIEFGSLLHHARKTLYDIAGMLDSVLHIRDYSGTLAKVVISENVVSAVRALSGTVRTVASRLNEILQGVPRSLESEQGKFASDVIANLTSINGLSTTLRDSSKAILPKMNAIQSDLANMVKAKNRLIRSATLLEKRLEQAMIKKLKVPKKIDMPRAATAELTTSMKGLRNPINALLKSVADAMGNVVDIIQRSSEGVNAFKTQIKFDIISPQIRVDLNELSGSVRELLRNVTRLRKATS